MTRTTPLPEDSPSQLDAAIAAAIDHHRSGRLDEAEACYRDILQTAPGHAGVLHNLGVIAGQRGDSLAALELFDRALAIKPDYAEAQLNRAGALQALGRYAEALAGYDCAIALCPAHPEPHNGRGDLLRRTGRFEEAARSYARALALYSDHYRARFGRGLALAALGRHDEAVEQFRATLALRRGDRASESGHHSVRTISRLKLEHDIAQFRYLAAQGRDPDRFAALADRYQRVGKEIDWPADAAEPVPFPDHRGAAVADSYNRPIHIADAPAMAGTAINPRLDTAAIMARYAAAAPGVAWFDDLLTPEALEALRRFLLESTIWFDFTHIGGFVAAYLEDGMACPLLLQIASDLRRAFPDLLGDLPLTQAWAFKCVDGRKGVDVHADAAAVSVNFWVTPNKANLRPDDGGLVVYRASPPTGWHLTSYRSDIARIRAFLAGTGDAEKVVVPYRENRAVLFNSMLFHESGAVAFAPGYENHRINITMLFGNPDAGRP